MNSNELAVESRYAPPFKAEYFSLPPEAIEEARKLQKSQTQ
jgi:hypothetical protein